MPALPSDYLATGIVQFDSQPGVSHNVFVSTLFPNSEVEGLNFIGLSEAGIRWQIETNLSCVGFVLTRDGDRELIVILDSDATAEGESWPRAPSPRHSNPSPARLPGDR